jgi:hypothetical protein
VPAEICPAAHETQLLNWAAQHDASPSQWVYLTNAGVHICGFAGFPQGFRLTEGSIVLSTETGINCFGAAFWKFRL